MKIKLKEHQKDILKDLDESFKSNLKTLLCASCSSGKTIISILLALELIKHGKRVAISAYSKIDIRDQWALQIKKVAPELIGHLQIICSSQDVKKLSSLGLPVVSNNNIDKTKLLTLFIPQSACNDNMGDFDLLIIDEAHEYLEVSKGILKKIIENHSHQSTKILGLTGTGFDLISKGDFFKGASIVIYDMPTALADGIISDCLVDVLYFDFKLQENFYRKNELNKAGQDFCHKNLKLNKGGKRLLKNLHAEKLEVALKGLSGKTLIIVPPGVDENGIGFEEKIKNFINASLGDGSVIAVDKSCRTGKQEIRNEELFRNNPNVNYMVVINKCGTGWDFPELRNVVDLTFTRNPKVIIQRFSRAIRLHESKSIARYIYCTDQSRPQEQVRFCLCQALELTTKQGILSYDGKTWSEFLRGEKLKGPLKISDFFDYGEAIKSVHKRNIFRRTLSSVLNSNKLDPIFSPFFSSWVLDGPKAQSSIASLFNKMKIMKSRLSDESLYARASLRLCKTYNESLYQEIFGDCSAKEIVSAYL